MSLSEEEIKLYTVTQVSEMCAVGAHTVRLWLKEKKLPGIKLDNQWRIKHSDLIHFLNERYGV